MKLIIIYINMYVLYTHVHEIKLIYNTFIYRSILCNFTSNSSNMRNFVVICSMMLQGVLNECIFSSEVNFNRHPVLREQ